MAVDYKKQYKPEHLEPFFPNEIVKMIIVVLCTLAVLMFMVVLPLHLEHIGLGGIAHEEEPADPGTTPAHIRPEWYFLAVFQYLKLMPADIFGISGKALGILSQMVVVILWLIVPFWYPLRAANLDPNKWRTGLLTFFAQLLAFIVPAAVLLWLQTLLPAPLDQIIHPMFAWPVLAIVAFLLTGLIAAGTFLGDAFQWLKLFNTAVIFIGLQAMTFLVVLGQWLSGVINPRIGYLISILLFAASSILVAMFIISRIKGTDKKFRLKLMTALITECIALFLGLTIWAMWPHEGLFAKTDPHQTQQFLFSIAVMAVCACALYAFLITELRTVHRILMPDERDKTT